MAPERPERDRVARRRYRKILTRMWADDKFLELSKPKPNGQTLWQYLIAGPHTTAVPGLFTAGEAALAESLGWSIAGFRRAWREIESRKMAEADWRARVVWLPNAIRHNSPESPNVVKGWRDTLDEIPACALKQKALRQLEGFLKGLGEAFLKAFQERTAHPSPNQEQEQEQEQERETREGRPSGKASHQTGSGVMAGTLPREHLTHVYCDPTYSRCVPEAVHRRFVAALAPKHLGDRVATGTELVRWYQTVLATLPENFVMGDAFRFWQPHFDLEFASKDPATDKRTRDPKFTIPSADATARRYLQRGGK